MEAIDGASSTLTIDPQTFALTELILNINATANGFVAFCDNNGCYGGGSGTLFALDGNAKISSI